MKFSITKVATGIVMASSLLIGQQAFAASQADIEAGFKLATNKKKGNCQACHAFKGAKDPGRYGPPLVAMKARYPDKAKLRAKIWGDPKLHVPYSAMIPFGRNLVLSEKEIDQLTEWAYTL